MDFSEAIKAHSDWKLKLVLYLDNPDKSLKADEVAADNKCALGKWIYGDGTKFNKLPEYQSLLQEHAKFHNAAAAVIKKADSGAQVKGEVALGAKSEFAAASASVVSAIVKMKAKVS